MYFDLSVKKVGIMIVLSLMLMSAVTFTLIAKRLTFGSTPYTYTFVIGSRYVLDSLMEEAGGFLHAAFSGRLFATTATQDPPESYATSVPVLTYHRVVQDKSDLNNVTVATFRDQMQTLKDAGWQTVSLADFEAFMQGEKQLPEKSFLLTFDDGAKESFYPVDPILRTLGFHGVIFVIAHEAENAETSGSIYYLSPEEIKRMLKTGRWDIGSHSYDGHRPYPVDPNGATGIFFADRLWLPGDSRLETPDEFTARVHDDLQKAKDTLQSEYNVPIKSFAFPLGNETGILGANNFPEGSAVTQEEASKIYQFGFIQLENQHFTFTFPRSSSTVPPSTLSLLSEPFLVRRIHVDYDWSGARLLSILENGLPKQLPYEDDFTKNNGWIVPWGTIGIGRNNFVMNAAGDSKGVSTFLDGTELWDNYSFDAAFNWHQGDLFILADVSNSSTYDSCAFSPGRLRILSTVNGQVHQIQDIRDPRIQFGDNVRMGARAHGDTFECTWNFQSIGEYYTRTLKGGVGFQMWDQTPGASVQVTSMIVRPYSISSTQ